MTDYIVVANSTPIILLQKVGQLELIKRLYHKVCIPEAVYNEVVNNDKNKDGDFISALSWIEIIKIQNVQVKKFFATNLHKGEAETIILATEKTVA